MNPRFSLPFFAFLAALALFACSGANPASPEALGAPPATPNANADADGGPADSGGLPCEVARVVKDVCQTCHSNPPAAGAPMPLVSWEDTQRPSKSNPAEPVWKRMKARLHDAAHPMPPITPLAPSDLAALDAWLDAGAPRSDASCAPPPDASAPPPSGPDALPCPASDRKTFLAHGAQPGSKFQVEASAGNEFACFTWRSPFGVPTQATAFAPVIDDKRVVHHWILYQSASQQPDGQFGPCNMPTDARFVAGWAPGGGNSVLPTDVGQNLQGQTGSFILQLHYWNTAGYTDANDASGVAMCTTTTPRPHAAAVVALGTLNIAIPPHTADYTANAACTDHATSDIHIINTAPHMHTRGTAFKTEILRGGNPLAADTLVDVPNWDFNNQAGHPVDMLLHPGDVLRTQCHYANTTDTTIRFGERTEDEMCFNFVLVWPVSAITSIFGPVTYCND
jgi:Copper type II ascorbate-dependent monooxygenase, C-terminal domain/Copper type II ascorbate-dependent monooxygenase, N-terminal domain